MDAPAEIRQIIFNFFAAQTTHASNAAQI